MIIIKNNAIIDFNGFPKSNGYCISIFFLAFYIFLSLPLSCSPRTFIQAIKIDQLYVCDSFGISKHIHTFAFEIQTFLPCSHFVSFSSTTHQYSNLVNLLIDAAAYLVACPSEPTYRKVMNIIHMTVNILFDFGLYIGAVS